MNPNDEGSKALDQDEHNVDAHSKRVIIRYQDPTDGYWYNWVPSTAPYKVLLDDTSTANVTYVGKAPIGSATSAAVWQIQKIDETSGMSITWANGGLFTAKWTEILTETYT